MWGLDRLSAYSTPSGTPPPRRDSYSPAPRRGYPAPASGPLPPRPGLVPRTSSLSLISPGASNTSLPSTARVPNGGPRRRPTGGLHHGPDPVQVLASIMGGVPRKPLAGAGEKAQAISKKPDVVVEEIDFGGLSLRDFAAAEAPREHERSTIVHTYSAQSVEECMCSSLTSRSVAHCDRSRQGER